MLNEGEIQKRTWFNCALVAVLFLCSSALHYSFLLGQEVTQKPRYKVQVDITASDDIKSRVQSYLYRNLRKIGDVTIVEPEDNASWKLSVIVVPSKLERGATIGHTFSVNVLKPFNLIHYRNAQIEFAKSSLKLWCPESKMNSICLMPLDTIFKTTDTSYFEFFFLKSLYSYEGHWLQVGPDMEKECEEIVIEFDSDHLEKDRRFIQKWHEMNEEFKQQSQKKN